jgi:hypothetical protein
MLVKENNAFTLRRMKYEKALNGGGHVEEHKLNKEGE